MVNLSSNFPFAYKLDLLIKDIISLIESEVLQSTNCEEVLSNCKFYIDKIFYFANSDSIAANIWNHLTDMIDALAKDASSSLVKQNIDRLFLNLTKVLG